MQQEMFKQFNSLHQTAYEASRQLAEINVRAYERLVKAQFAAVGSCVDRMNKQLEVVREPKELAEYLRTQGELVKDCAEKTLALNKESLDILTEARSEYNDLLEKGLAKAPGTLKPVAEKEAA
jgi:phasin family protein